jgi:hypothetical protein
MLTDMKIEEVQLFFLTKLENVFLVPYFNFKECLILKRGLQFVTFCISMKHSDDKKYPRGEFDDHIHNTNILVKSSNCNDTQECYPNMNYYSSFLSNKQLEFFFKSKQNFTQVNE